MTPLPTSLIPIGTAVPKTASTFARIPGNYEVAFNLSINYAIVYNALAAVKLQVQQDLLLAIGLPTNRCIVLNATQLDTSLTLVTTGWIGSADPTVETPALYYDLLVQQSAQSYSPLRTHTQVLATTNNIILNYPLPADNSRAGQQNLSTTGQQSTSANPIIVVSLTCITGAYLGALYLANTWYKALRPKRA
jgi:hypothetical protein